MSYDIFNHHRTFQAWKHNVLTSDGGINLKYIEERLTKANSKIFVQYLLDMESGTNISVKSIKGPRSPKTLNRLRSKIKSIMIGLQKKGFSDITKMKARDVNLYFKEWIESGHTNDYAKRFRAFWNWWLKKNRNKGVMMLDISEDLNTNASKESKFVWLNKDEFDVFRKHFDHEKQLCLLFSWDSIVRAPSELFGLKVENVYQKGSEVWVNIPDEITKTFARQFNLIYSGEEVWKHIQDKSPSDALFTFSYVNFTKEMQKIAKQLWKNLKSQGGEYYKNITLYDFRHSGAIHLRQLFQRTGQSLDSLRHRGGWSDFRMINYYTKFLGLDGHIDKEKTLLQEDKTKLEREFQNLKQSNEEFSRELQEIKDDYGKFLDGKNFMKLFLSLAQKQDEQARQIAQLRNSKFDVVLDRKRYR